MSESIVQQKSLSLAIKILVLKENTLSDNFNIKRQLIKSCTSVGANIAEAQYAESRADFIHKLSIALKEASETEFWLTLLCSLSNTDQNNVLLKECKEVCALLVSSLKTLKTSEQRTGNK